MVDPHIRYDWTVEEVVNLFELPFMELAFRAQEVHRAHHNSGQMQLCTLSNIKSGGCPEDCAYCPQAARYHTDAPTHRLLSVDTVVDQARRAKEAGSTRFCMGAAWREIRNNRDFDDVLTMVREVADMGLEVCATLGMLTDDQARRLAEAGLTAYNHNLDTSPEFYGNIITTRDYENRLQTLQSVRRAGLQVCSGGIVGMGETVADRASMLTVLAAMNPHPESVPINSLVPVPGTPLGERAKVSVFDFLRTLAVARIVLPQARIRLAAGRSELTPEAQTLAFMVGANSIFYGEALLTTPNAEVTADRALMDELGLAPLDPYAQETPSA